jgi:2-polyprenyl-3-methyl-5-hydroxy-6-metoxy-1,4-benzoquinol methylase
MHFHTERFAEVVDAWARHAVVSQSAEPFTPPPGPRESERRREAAFLREQVAASAAGEPEYQLSTLDWLLCAIDNGSVAGGVEFFAATRTTELGSFISDVVAQIDRAAWTLFGAHLPEPRPGRRARMAVLGCGAGTGIELLLSIEPALAEWDITGIDIDAAAIADARERFRERPNVRFVAGDVRDAEALEAGAYDLVYNHGVFDHCAGHRAIVESCFRALRPGGKLFYITPDRNVATWIGFVSVGPRAIFRLGEHAHVHDFRRFGTPAELDLLLARCGFRVERERDDPARALHRGVEYRSGPLGIGLGVWMRDLRRLELHLTRPRAWLGGGGFKGEYLGIAVKPEMSKVGGGACARM